MAHCLSCSGIVSSRMHAVACDTCGGWQHRRCGTGISAVDYKRMVQGDLNISWNCNSCSPQESELEISVSTTTEDTALVTPEVPDSQQEQTLSVIENQSFNIPDREFERQEPIAERFVHSHYYYFF